MPLKQETIVFHRTDENGNKVVQMPITTAENVEGLIIDLPLGHMYWSIEPNVPVGRLPAFGALYNRALYADLWAYAQERGLVISESEWQAQASANNGNCRYYSDGDGSTTFRVPSLKCWIKGANGIEEVGSYLQAGLPNITGDFVAGMSFEANTTATGAFSITTNRKQRKSWNDAYNTTGDGFTFDASRCSSIYGNSDTVQPPSIAGMFLIVAFGVAHNIGEADVADVMQAVEQVQTELNKVDGISDYIIESYRNGTEWYEVYKSGKVRQGGRIVTNAGLTTITFLKAFSSAMMYHLTVSMTSSSTTNEPKYVKIQTKTGTNTTVALAYHTNNGNYAFIAEAVSWVAEGMGV